MEKYHYTYQIVEISTGKKYIGVRSSAIKPEEDLGIKYFSSGDKSFVKAQKRDPSNYRYEVLSIFSTREEAMRHEIELHDRYNVNVSDEYFNAAKSISTGFDVSGSVVVKDLNGNTMLVSINDPRYLSGELVHHTSGFLTVKHSVTGETKFVTLDDPRYLSGEYVCLSAGMIRCYDKDGNMYKVSTDDARFLSGELVAFSKGKLVAKDKSGKLYQVSVDDARLESGELVPYFTDVVSIRNKDGTCSYVTKEEFDCNDELSGVNVGKVLCKDKNGNSFIVAKDDHRLSTGELVGFAKNKVNVFDPLTGETMQVSKDDPRYLSKELLHTYYMKSEEERSKIGGKGMKYVTDLRNYIVRRVDADYVLAECEEFGMLKDPNLPKKIRKKTAINVNDLTYKTVEPDYILKEDEVFGNGRTMAMLKKKITHL